MRAAMIAVLIATAAIYAVAISAPPPCLSAVTQERFGALQAKVQLRDYFQTVNRIDGANAAASNVRYVLRLNEEIEREAAALTVEYEAANQCHIERMKEETV